MVKSLLDLDSGFLRSYQLAAIDRVAECRAAGHNMLIVQKPCGCGKTITGLALARKTGRTLWLTHRTELIDQPIEDVKTLWPGCRYGVVQQGRDDRLEKDVVFASVPSAVKRLDRKWNHFDLVIADECHRVMGETWRKVIDHFKAQSPPPLIVGLTATPGRHDGKNLSEAGFTCFAYRMTIKEAIRFGYLVPYVSERVVLPRLDLSNVKTGLDGDFNQKSLSEEYKRAHIAEHGAREIVERCAGRKVIVFTVDVDEAQKVSTELCRLGRRSLAVSEKTLPQNRKKALSDYKSGALDCLVNVGLYTEGFNEPSIGAVAMLRPTRSKGLYIQCLDNKMEVLTNNGWKTRETITQLDLAAAYHPDTGEIVWSAIRSIVDRSVSGDEKIVSLQTPTIDLRVTANHRMLWKARRAGPEFRFTEAGMLATKKSEYVLPVAGMQNSPGVPLSNAELRFIGWFLSDGTINKKTQQIMIAQAEHQPYNKDIVACLQECGFKFGISRIDRKSTNLPNASPVLHYYISRGAPRGTGKHLRGWGSLTPYIDKNLSFELESITHEQLSVMLEALHLGDGAKQINSSWTRRTYHISTGSKIFADRLQSLCVRRGFRCNVHTQSEKNIVIHIKKGTERAVGGTNQPDRKSMIVSDPIPGEKVWCVEVDHFGTIVTRRNGKVTIMGNCVGRGLRTFPGKADCLILDFTDASGLSDLQQAADLVKPPEGETEGLELFEDFGLGLPDPELEDKDPSEPKEESLLINSLLDGSTRGTRNRLQAGRVHWIEAAPNLFALPVGEDGTVVLFYDKGAWKAEVSAGGSRKLLLASADVGLVQAAGEAYAKAAGALGLSYGAARWRAKEASPGQLGMLGKLSTFTIEGSLTQGEASDLITAAIVRSRYKVQAREGFLYGVT